MPVLAEIEEWLRQMFKALQYWHGSGYCHGDLRWLNIVFVPAPYVYQHDGDTPTNNGGFWVLIDMDESYNSDSKVITWRHQYHGSKLRFQHDFAQLGHLIDSVMFDLPEKWRAMSRNLKNAVNDQSYTAETALTQLNGLNSYEALN